MKNLTILLLLLSFSFNLTAQENCDCKAELDFVYEKIKITESYKYQIKGEMSETFEQTYRELGVEMSEPMSKLTCFQKLNQLLSLIKDKHALLLEAQPDFEVKDIYDSTFTEQYRASEAFINFPKVDLDLDALRSSLEAKPVWDIEGVYNIGNAMKLGVYRVDGDDRFMGVILSSKLGTWAPGQIYLYMHPSQLAGHYDITYYSQVFKTLAFQKARQIEHGILSSNVIKEKLETNHVYVDAKTTDNYVLKQLNDKVQYVWLHSFGRSNENADKRDALIAQMSEELKADNLIVDLRNNGGGASKISWPIVKRIRKYAQKGKVYVLTNASSGSNAEQTTVRLIKLADATHLGQKTFGAVSYGRNYGTRLTSPSGLFQFLPTDMKFNQYLKYEDIGVVPEVKLSPDSDWVEQTIDIINAQNL
ncbi:MAG: hypothetical protein Roseis2KO_48230 [Roseivirga sp.]